MAIGGAIDELASRAYPCPVMKCFISRPIALVSILVGAGFPVAAEDLDAALAAQKNKAQRRVYSDSALIENRNLEVPRTSTEAEKAVDRKLREMDAKADSLATQPRMPVLSRTTGPAPTSPEYKNWLTPATMDDSAADALPDNKEEDWLLRELDRQKELKAQDALQKENAQIEKLLREKTQTPSSSPQMDRLKQYQLTPPNILGNSDKDSANPSYMTPQSGAPDPMINIRPASKQERAPVAPPLFSPQAARLSSTPDKDTRNSSFRPLSPTRASSGFSSGLDQTEPVPLTPLERIKKSSPINRPDPFSDDYSPQIKRSIWD